MPSATALPITASSSPAEIAGWLLTTLTSEAYSFSTVDGEIPPPHLQQNSLIFFDGHFWMFSTTGWLPYSPPRLALWIMRTLFSLSIPIEPPEADKVVRCLQALTESHGRLPPLWRPDENPVIDAPSAVSFEDCIVDLSRSSRLSDCVVNRDPRYFDPITLPHRSIDFSATCPRWLSFLAEVSDSSPDWILSLQRWFGYCLLPTNGLERILFLTGASRSGKTTIVEILRDLLGHENSATSSFQALGSQFGRQALLNKRLITLSEATTPRFADRTASTGVLKQIVGRDHIFVDIKRQSPVNALIPAKIVVVSNDIPTLDDVNNAITSKLIVLPFNRSFLGHEDTTLRDKLRSELPGILVWALAGAHSVVSSIYAGTAHRLFGDLPFSSEILETITLESNPIRAFATDCIVDAPTKFRISIKDLHSQYNIWREHSLADEIGIQAFGRLLTRERIGRPCRMPNGPRGRCGIMLRTPSAPIVAASPGAES